MNCVKLRVLNPHKERRVRQVEEFSIGGVLKATFQVFGKNLVPFILLGLVIVVPTFLVTIWIFGQVSPLAAILVSTLIVTLAATLMQAAYVHLVFHTLREAQSSLLDILTQAGRTIHYAIFTSIVASLIIGLGLLLLIVPGIIFAVMFWLAVPVSVIERKSPIAALKRSAQLAQGHKWKILGILTLFALFNFIIGLIAGQDADLNQIANPFTSLSSWISWIIGVLLAVAAGVAYYDLRFLKEDMDSEAIGEVFE